MKINKRDIKIQNAQKRENKSLCIMYILMHIYHTIPMSAYLCNKKIYFLEISITIVEAIKQRFNYLHDCKRNE